MEDLCGRKRRIFLHGNWKTKEVDESTPAEIALIESPPPPSPEFLRTSPFARVQSLLSLGRGGFHERLGKGRGSVDGAGDVLGAGAEFYRQHGLGDHLGCAGADDVHAQDAVGSDPGRLQVQLLRVSGRGPTITSSLSNSRVSDVTSDSMAAMGSGWDG